MRKKIFVLFIIVISFAVYAFIEKEIANGSSKISIVEDGNVSVIKAGVDQGEVVGTSGNQTLTNKTITSPQVNEAVNLTSTSTELNQLDGVTVGGSTSGDLVTIDGSQTLTNKTLTLPTIGDFTNAIHSHDNDAGGGSITVGAGSQIINGTTDVDIPTSGGDIVFTAGGTERARHDEDLGHWIFQNNQSGDGANVYFTDSSGNKDAALTVNSSGSIFTVNGITSSLYLKGGANVLQINSNGLYHESGGTDDGYVMYGFSETSNACGSVTSCTATCPAGKRAIGGGCYVSAGSTAIFYRMYRSSESAFTCVMTAARDQTTRVNCIYE